MLDKRFNRILALIVLLCFIIRLLIFVTLDRFYPELLSVNLAEGYLFPRLAARPWQVDWSYGPLSYLIYWLIGQMPFSFFTARILNFLIDSFSAYFVAIIAKRLISASRSLLATAFWAFAPPVIYASVFVTVDSLPVLVTLAAVYFALDGRRRWALVLVGVGFTLKWYPILLLPLMLRAYLPKRAYPSLSILSLSPFLLAGLLITVVSFISGFTVNDILALTIHNFSSRVPAGSSIWNLLQTLISANMTARAVLILASYSAILLTFLLIGVRSPVGTDIQLLGSSAVMLFCAVNIASQIQGNYLLWFYPLMLILIVREPIRAILIAKLSLLAGGFLFDYMFIYPRLSTIARGPTALIAIPTAYDIISITAYQASAWTLLYLLLRRESLLKIIARIRPKSIS